MLFIKFMIMSQKDEILERMREFDRIQNLKTLHQLFIGKVATEIGIDRTKELLKEARKALGL